jgi:hypothetical protein
LPIPFVAKRVALVLSVADDLVNVNNG